MKRWLYYHGLALRDLLRLWSTTQHHVIIVAGICLPILLLLGLKRGHVDELRRELLTSPTGRQVIFWSAQQGELLGHDVIERLTGEVPGAEVIIPDTQRLVILQSLPDLSKAKSGDLDHRPSDEGSCRVTLYPTRPGDPILAQHDADVIESGEHAVVLTSGTATQLGVKAGDGLVLIAERGSGDSREESRLEVTVKAVVPGGEDGGTVGYADVEIINAIEQYVQGHAVKRLGWPAEQDAAIPSQYASYLVFCEQGAETDLNDDDRGFFEERSLTVGDVTDPQLKSLFGLLTPEKLGKLRVYIIRPTNAGSDPDSRITQSPLYISNSTRAIDDFVMRWNKPAVYEINGRRVRLLGVSLPDVDQEGGWIRDYLVPAARVFSFEQSFKEPFSIRPLSTELKWDIDEVSLVLPGGESIPLKVASSAPVVEPPEQEAPNPADVPAPPDAAPSSDGKDASGESDKTPPRLPANPPQVVPPATVRKKTRTSNDAPPASTNDLPLAVVPAPLLASLDAHRRGKADFDLLSGKFVPKPEPIIYDKARLYTHTIDDVPHAVGMLRQRGFAVLSESTRITEIHEQDASLQLLVLVVGAGVFLFGVVTVISVLVDSTDRKRGTIGILRVMGVSRWGVFYLVVLRAAVIGLLAGSLCAVLGYGIAWSLAADPDVAWLEWKPAINVALSLTDLVLVFTGALLCSGVGAIVPAWKASSLDPFDAIIEGRFH